MHKKFQVAIFVLALVVSGCMNQEEEKTKEEIELEKILSIQYYTIHVIPSLSDHTMEVEAEVTLKISEPITQVTFCLNPEFSVSHITDETGVSLTFEREYDLVTVEIPDLQATQKRLTFVYDGMVYQRSAETTWDYVGEEGCWVRTQYNWYPVIPGAAEAGCHFWLWWHQSYWAGATLSVEVPLSWTVISSGTCVSEDVEGDTKTCTWQESQVIPGLNFVAGEYAVMTDWWNGKEVTCYFADHAERAQECIDLSKSILEFYTERFGEYPFSQLSLVEVPGDYGAAQGKPSFVMLDSAVFSASEEDFVQALSETIAFQWWGNVVSGYDVGSIICLQYCISSFARLQFMKEKYGEDYYCTSLTEAVTMAEEAFSTHGSASITEYGLRRMNDELAEAVIIKTTLMIFALEEKLGDESFFEALRALLTKYKGESITIEAFQEELEYASGENLDQFFEQYYYGKEIPSVKC